MSHPSSPAERGTATSGPQKASRNTAEALGSARTPGSDRDSAETSSSARNPGSAHDSTETANPTQPATQATSPATQPATRPAQGAERKPGVSSRKSKAPKINLMSVAAGKTVKLSVVLSIGTALCTALSFVFLGQVLQAVLEQTSYWGWLCAALLTIAGAAVLSAYVIGLTGNASVREETQIRRKLLGHVLALGPVDRTDDRSGSLASSATDGVERVGMFKLTFFGPMIAAAISPLVVLAVVAVAIDWFSALVLLIAVPAIPLLVGGFQMAFRKVSGNSREARQKLAAEYLDAIQGLTTLGLLNASARTQDRLEASGEANRRSIMKLLASNQLVLLIVDGVFSLFMIGAVAWLAMARFDAGHIGFGQAVSLILISLVLLEPLNKVGEFFYVGMGGLAAQRGMRGFLSSPVRVVSGAGLLPDDESGSQPLVEFRDTHFSYGDLEVLRGVNLSVRRGEHVAIVGASGAGKSTIAALVQRNIPVSQGQLFLRGADATSLDTAQARSLSATVGQTTFLFTGTLRANLLIARADAEDSVLWEVLETANLAQEVRAMPQGLDTVVGERGYSLSGGQAQRLAIARALLADAPLLILDEPTSQVDLEGEAAILAAIEKAVKGRTVLTIAHRPSTLRSVDRVLRLEDGQLVEVTA